MFSLIKRLIGILMIAAVLFLLLSLWKGGKPFRWFGKKSEQAGEAVREKSNQLAEEADKIKKKTDNVTDTTKKVTEDIREVRKKIEYITGSREKK